MIKLVIGQRTMVVALLTVGLLAACTSSKMPDDTANTGVGIEDRTSNGVVVGSGQTSDGKTTADADATARAALEAQAAAARQVAEEARHKAELKAQALSNATVYFGFDRYDLSIDAQTMVDKHAEYLKATPATIVIEGHTDDRGSREYNLALGQRRANAVASSLKLLGVDAAKIEAISFGEEQPAKEGNNESAYEVNRRAYMNYGQGQ